MSPAMRVAARRADTVRRTVPEVILVCSVASRLRRRAAPTLSLSRVSAFLESLPSEWKLWDSSLWQGFLVKAGRHFVRCII